MLPKGTQLGRRQRLILLEAAAQDDAQPKLLLPHGPGVSAQTKAREATAKLVRLGLLFVVPEVMARNGVADVRKLFRLLPATPGWDPTQTERLVYAFFVTRTDGQREIKQRVRLRSVRRTALGDQVVERYGRQLESARAPGKMLPIRWK